MQFLNPFVLFGLLAASIPVLLEFYFRKKRKKKDFSSLKLIRETELKQIKKIHILQLILLIIRTLIIILIVLAFADPVIKLEGGVNNKIDNSDILVLLDDSFSMSERRGDEYLFNEAKNQIKKIFAKTGDKNKFSFCTFSGRKMFSGLSKNDLKKIIVETEWSYLKPDSAKLFEAIYNFQRQKRTEGEIFLITDLQNNTLPLIKNFMKQTEKKEILNIIPVNSKNKVNVALSNFQISNSIIGKNATLKCVAEIKNFSTRKVADKTMSLYINGQKKIQKSFSLEINSSKNVEFEIQTDKPGWNKIEVELEEDDLTADNNYYFVINSLSKINIALLYEDQKDIKYLQKLLDSELFKYDLDILKFNTIQNSFPFIPDQRVVVAVGVTNPKTIEYVFQKKLPVLYFPGSNNNLNNTTEIFNTNRNGIKINRLIDVNANNYSFKKLDYKHNVFSGIFNSDEKTYKSPDIYKFFDITSKGKNIISTNFDKPLLTERGNLLFFAISPELKYSNFPLNSLFAPVIMRCIEYMHNKKVSLQYMTGEAINLDKLKINSMNIKINGPGGTEEYYNNEKQDFEFRNNMRPGFYNVFDLKDTVLVFASNLNADESNTLITDDVNLNRILKTNPNVFIYNDVADWSLTKKSVYNYDLKNILFIIVILLMMLELFLGKGRLYNE